MSVPAHQHAAAAVLTSARLRFGADPAALRAQLSDGVDWDWLVDTASRHGTATFLLPALQSHAADLVPPGVLSRLQQADHVGSLVGQVLTTGLVDVLDLFSAEGVSVLAFKGPVLALDLYGSTGLRTFGDLDLLVHPRDYRRAGRLLVGEGYIPMGRRLSWERSYRRELVTVDLHRGLAPPRFRFPLRFDDLWARRRIVQMNDASIATLSWEDLVLVLCVQVAKDAWEEKLRLAKVTDLAELLAHGGQIDWPATVGRAESIGAAGVLSFGTGLAGRILGVQVPDAVARRAAAGPDVTGLVDLAAGRLFDQREVRPSAASMRRFHAGLRERRRDRIFAAVDLRSDLSQLVNRTVRPNENDRAAVSLPRGMGGLYVAVRPLRLLAKKLRQRSARSRRSPDR